jgi:hypothetical protein
MIKSRNQNPVVGDDIRLGFITFNSNNLAPVNSVDHIDILYFGDCHDKKCHEPPDPLLIETIPGNLVTSECPGKYSYVLATSAPKYSIGKYHDVWNIQYRYGDPLTKVPKSFEIYPDLWITATMEAVYSFDFRFQPNRIRKGSKKWLQIQIVPNIPTATDLMRYYENLAISAELKIWIELDCGPCPPNDCNDLNIIVDGETVWERDKVFAFYKLDTTEWECGIYNTWFELDFAGTTEISPKMQFLIY